jgi:hypothetical protein
MADEIDESESPEAQAAEDAGALAAKLADDDDIGKGDG